MSLTEIWGGGGIYMLLPWFLNSFQLGTWTQPYTEVFHIACHSLKVFLVQLASFLSCKSTILGTM